QDFVVGAASNTVSYHNDSATTALPPPVKYYDRMKMYEPEVVTQYGMTTYFDYDEALAVARKLHKPLMLDFTGINFVIVSLYVDVHDVDLQPNEEYYSKTLNKQITTLGDKNADLQVTQYNANVQPYYFFLDARENRLEPEGYGYDSNVEKFKNMLDDVVAKYNAEKS